MNATDIYYDKMTKTPLAKLIISLGIPTTISMLITNVYNMVDTFFIAKTGNTNLIAGISLCAPIFTFMIALGDIFGLGGCSFISRLLGEKNEEAGRSCFDHVAGELENKKECQFLVLNS